MKHSDEWDFLTFKEIPETSTSANLFPSFFGSNPNLLKRTSSECPFLLLPDSYEEFYQNLERKFRKNLRNGEKNLKKLGRIEIKTHNEISGTEEAIKTLFILHQKRWRAKGQRGAFIDSTNRAFHQEIAKRFAEKGWLRLNFLTIDDKPIAAAYCFEYKQKMYDRARDGKDRYGKHDSCISQGANRCHD